VTRPAPRHAAPGPYVPDQAAVNWARATTEWLLTRMEDHHRWLEVNRPAEAEGYRKAMSWVRRELVGGKGCVVAAFDSRRPEIERLLR
jgi:hypothetical protein